MVRLALARIALGAALALALPGTVAAQDDDLTPRSINALALQFEVQQEQIDRLDDRLDNIRVGTLRDRLKALESAVAGLGGQFATTPTAFLTSGRPAPRDIPPSEAVE